MNTLSEQHKAVTQLPHIASHRIVVDLRMDGYEGSALAKNHYRSPWCTSVTADISNILTTTYSRGISQIFARHRVGVLQGEISLENVNTKSFAKLRIRNFPETNKGRD
jgi:hypothetical protein